MKFGLGEKTHCLPTYWQLDKSGWDHSVKVEGELAGLRGEKDIGGENFLCAALREQSSARHCRALLGTIFPPSPFSYSSFKIECPNGHLGRQQKSRDYIKKV